MLKTWNKIFLLSAVFIFQTSLRLIYKKVLLLKSHHERQFSTLTSQMIVETRGDSIDIFNSYIVLRLNLIDFFFVDWHFQYDSAFIVLTWLWFDYRIDWIFKIQFDLEF